MRLEYLHHHMNRRQMLGTMAKAGAVGAVVAGGGGSLLAGQAGASDAPTRGDRKPDDGGGYDDSFSVEGALNGEWARETAARYGEDDQLGTLNEVTPEKTASALAICAGARAVRSVTMGHVMRNGFPAFATFPPRDYQQRLTVLGYEPPEPDRFFTADTQDAAGLAAWRAADLERGPLGYLQGTEPLGANMVSGHEERFPHGITFQHATQLDNLSHIGVGDVFYNGFRSSDIANPEGANKLGMEHVQPFTTRGVLIDVLGWKLSCTSSDVQTVNGNQMLADSYRITLEDLLDTLRWQGGPRIEPGDVVLIRTGWWWLAEDPETWEKYLATEPGIYLREAKFLGDHHPAIIGSDTWALEVIGHPDLVEWAFPVHQELLTKRGIRIGEAIITHELAELGRFEFAYCYCPQISQGGTAGNTPPQALVPM